MKPITCVFFGASGSGKGTQAKLLIEYLAKKDSKRKSLYVETGQRFRDFTKSQNYTASKVKEIMAAGKFLPPFFPIWTWAGFLIENFTGEEHLIFDGVCRQPEEGPVFHSALQFYGRAMPVILLLKMRNKEVEKRLLKRGRYDDTLEKIDERLRSFEKNAMPSVEYFQKNPECKFVTIDGDQSIEAVFEDVKKALEI